ncbi:MAG: hypothetical protein A2161_15285 [Candidatus Schekmanbacteria bacterium RBG_13_48_7]|uniref:GAF domain-containing protein n=1 Tax=Candidatus Schekmanbacteria bacterium RBG_13_48_7 TaxID=1817878 RepID=A0A1F7RMD0_9BACT|nr:MAG: hypothetical protein A2161_15285 [Candidatus Schekmanbacteria bacterium RBG_13_48_7]
MDKFKDKIFDKAEYFLDLFTKGREFTEELLKENERLRYELLKLERSKNFPDELLNPSNTRMLSTIEEMEEQIDRLKEKIAAVEAENIDFAKRYVDIEEENDKLANLYVASFHLHSTLELQTIMKTISEIIIDLVGAEKFAVYVTENEPGKLMPVIAEGMNLKDLKFINVGQGKEGEIAATGDIFFVPQEDDHPAETGEPIVIIPLKMKDELMGLISIYSLLSQKAKLTHIDFELFSLLASHAASALFSAKMYSISNRKLSTMEGIFELLKDS